MFTKDIATNVLNECLTTGADFAEIFFEDTYKGNLEMISGKIKSAESNKIYGAGIRILKDLEQAYGYTNDCSEEGLLSLAKKLKGSFKGKPLGIKFELKEETAKETAVKIKRPSDTVDPKEKKEYLDIVYKAATEYSDKIVQTIIQFQETTQRVTIANTNGKFIHDLRNQQRIYATAVAKSGDKMHQIKSSVGGNFGIDTYKEKDLKGLGEFVAKGACDMVDAPEMVGGVYTVVVHNGFGGVLFHEAVGHSLEATSVARNMSVFSGKLGEKIAADCVNAVDDGTIYNEWGSTNIDDEGNPTKRNQLITNGVLTGYMIDDRNTRIMHMPSTGNSRRESYRYAPTSRMTNTFIVNGDFTFEEIIKNTKHGLFAAHMGGGSVNPVTGEFNFAVDVGYMIEDGKITTPVRGATLIGNGANALLNIDMVANNQTFGHGMCGSLSGSIPANVGEPTIRIKNITVGGNGGNK